MSIKFSSVIDAPIADVFAWHERPGAVKRLTPPWQPVRVVEEATSLRDGQAVMALPGGLRWKAQHEADYYRPGRQFVDHLVSPPATWRHIHKFRPEDNDTTRMTDLVVTLAPAVALRSMFQYRHRQLIDDLAVHRRMADLRKEKLTVAITGSSGTVGSSLSALLSTGGHKVIRLVRGESQGDHERQWDPHSPAADLLEGVDAVIHLAGESIAGRFTDARMRAIRDSRVEPTKKLVEIAARQGVETFVSASAIGFYGPDREGEVLEEDSPRGDGFLADVVDEWEGATQPAATTGMRIVQVRTGIVLTPQGGVLAINRPLFQASLGGPMGTGQEWFSWIGIDDLLDIYLRALIDPAMTGPFNAVSPQPVRNREYARILARVLRRPALLPVPRFGPRIMLGEQGAEELAETNQYVSAERLLGHGHQFRHPDLESTLRHLFGRVEA